MDNLTLDDRFHLLLHKKLMNKQGAALRRAKKYYKDQYRKTGIIPGPLLLAEKGIMEGRRCSGRPRSLDDEGPQAFYCHGQGILRPVKPGVYFYHQKGQNHKELPSLASSGVEPARLHCRPPAFGEARQSKIVSH